MTFSAALADFRAQFSQVDNPQDFVRPDGSYDITEINTPDPDQVRDIREQLKEMQTCPQS